MPYIDRSELISLYLLKSSSNPVYFQTVVWSRSSHGASNEWLDCSGAWWHSFGCCKFMHDKSDFPDSSTFRFISQSTCSIKTLLGQNVNRQGGNYSREYRGGGGPPKPPSNKRIGGFATLQDCNVPGGG